MTLGWAAPRPHSSHVETPQFSTGSRHSPSDTPRLRPHVLSKLQRGWAKDKDYAINCREEDAWEEVRVDKTRGGEGQLKDTMGRPPERDPTSLIFQERILFQNSGKWVSLQSGFPSGLESKHASFTSGTSLTISPLSPQAAFASVPSAK